MVEVIGWIVAHPQPLHHSAGLVVDCGRERDDLVAAESIKAEGERRAGRLGCVALTPGATVQPPSNLDGWCEVRFEPRLIEADKTDERSAIDKLDGPQSPTLAGNHRLNMGGELVALRLGQRCWEVPHDLGIRVESSERIEIGLPPLSEEKTWRRELRHRVIVTVVYAAPQIGCDGSRPDRWRCKGRLTGHGLDRREAMRREVRARRGSYGG
jgi:hypothetical protein